MQHRITPNLWFDTQAEEAASFYTSVFPNSRIVSVSRYPEGAPREAGMVMTVEFELDGQRIVGINGGPEFTFDEAVSLQINCKDQAEGDYYWDKLTQGGGDGPGRRRAGGLGSPGGVGSWPHDDHRSGRDDVRLAGRRVGTAGRCAGVGALGL